MFWLNYSTSDHWLFITRNTLNESKRWALYDYQRIRNPLWEFSHICDEKTTPSLTRCTWAKYNNFRAIGKEESIGVNGLGTEEKERYTGEANKGEKACLRQKEGRRNRLLEVSS